VYIETCVDVFFYDSNRLLDIPVLDNQCFVFAIVFSLLELLNLISILYLQSCRPKSK